MGYRNLVIVIISTCLCADNFVDFERIERSLLSERISIYTGDFYAIKTKGNKTLLNLYKKKKKIKIAIYRNVLATAPCD